MANERRYGEDEVRAILDVATSREDVEATLPSGEHGMTLAEIQEIGRQVGVAPSQIEDAALIVDARGAVVPRRTSMGMPISVGRAIQLPRALTDREWELLVVELRETFHAKGKVSAHGSIREWRNGNLHASVEPTESGHRLRLGTTKAGAGTMNKLGAIGVAAGLLSIPLALLAPGIPTDPVLWAGLGGAALVANLLRLPSWARKREQQMEHVIARLSAWVGRISPDTPAPDRLK